MSPDQSSSNNAITTGIGSGSGGGFSFLLRFIDSNQFTLFHCISYLERYADEIGIHFHIAQKLRHYSDDEIEFFIPQIVQLHVTIKTDSLALEDLILELCNRSTHAAVLIFWQVQAHLTELANEPEAHGFLVCQRLMAKLQHILFNVGLPPEDKILENIQPATILAGSIGAAFGMPGIVDHIKPLVLSQGRKKRSLVFHLANKAALATAHSLSNLRKNNSSTPTSLARYNTLSMSDLKSATLSTPSSPMSSVPDLYPGLLNYRREQAFSLPQLNQHYTSGASANPTVLPHTQMKMIKTLKSNYFYCETQFMDALHKISNKLTQVPKQARLSALRVEIAMLNKDLPAEVDIPLLLSSSSSSSASIRSVSSSASSSDHGRGGDQLPRQNRVVRIVPSEAVLLNSAERVPYLLLIEYIKNDIDFDPFSEKNKAILSSEHSRRHIFDSISTPLRDYHSASAPSSARNSEDGSLAYHRSSESALSRYKVPLDSENGILPNEESDMGDISVIDLFEDKRAISKNDQLSASLSSLTSSLPSSFFTAVNGGLSQTTASPRSSDLSFSPAYMTPVPPKADEVDELATHMRTAALMINQLDESAGNSTLSKDEIQGIKNKIIASMQSMEEHNIYQTSNILAQGDAGERKMENDLIISGIDDQQQAKAKGHLRQSSVAKANTLNLGEDWKAKRERIRKTSPYGHYPNWDLFSCIVKTGSDLRQEAFACQLIQAMQMCWDRCNTGVWVKRMRILITHNSAGLVETITNALSIHSIKKAMTTASMENGGNPKGTIQSLKSYFEMTYGSSGPKYDNAVNNFTRSLAAYSVICYLLQIKDRHNGNILLDSEGHIVHIDFGFLLSNSPGSVGFETSPFKLTMEYVELMGGVNSETFQLFKTLVKQAFKDIRKEAESIIILVEMMQRDSTLPCFASGPATAQQLRQRFQLHMSEQEVDNFVEHMLIQKSLGSLSTRLYDQFQLLTQGIYS